MNNSDQTNTKSINYQMRPRPRIENQLPEMKHLTRFETFESIMESDQTTALKEIVQKHSDWLTETTIQDVHCDILSVSCGEFDREQSTKTPFLQLITKQLRKSKDMFIIRPHMHCQTPSFKRFDISQLDQLQDVDQVSFMAYDKLSSKDKNWIFRRHLSNDPAKLADQQILKVTHSSERSVENLKKMNLQEPLPEMTMESTIFSLDFRFHWKAVSRFGVQIENCGLVEDLTDPEPHYLNVSSAVTPMLAFPFIDGFPVRGFSSTYLYYSFPGSTTPFHSEDGGCAALNQNLGFESKIWVAVAQKYALKMWTLLKDHNDSYASRKDPCPAHFRKKADFIFVTQLKDWGIPFKIAIQQRGDIVVTPTGVPHQVTSAGYTANESVNIIDPLWFHMTPEDCILCPTREACGYAHGHDWESLTGLDKFRIDDVKHRWLNHPESCGVIEPKHKVGDFDYRSCDECFPCEEIDLEYEGKIEPLFQDQGIQVQIQKQDFSHTAQFECPKCPASFQHGHTLTRHHQRIHGAGSRKLVLRCRKRKEDISKKRIARILAARAKSSPGLMKTLQKLGDLTIVRTGRRYSHGRKMKYALLHARLLKSDHRLKERSQLGVLKQVAHDLNACKLRNRSPDLSATAPSTSDPSTSGSSTSDQILADTTQSLAVPPKRKRGSPAAYLRTDTWLLSNPVIPKRKRGRPPHDKPSNPVIPKRKRGRPPHATPSNPVIPKRKRGRPPHDKPLNPVIPKRKRGRPPHDKPLNPVIPKRKRGRPSHDKPPNPVIPKRKRGRPPHANPSNPDPSLKETEIEPRS